MPCNPPKTNADKKFPYVEYYLGDRDEENRKTGKGRHHWSGAESLEWYHGHMLRDTMHGDGAYCWRYLGPDHSDITYEGWFYNNCLHGYGVMSYPDGRVFNGLYHKNFRWGPGVESHAALSEDVGLWYGYQLIRLAWRPAVPSVAIDFMSNSSGVNTVTPLRELLTINVKTIGELNSALDLLKQSGCEPMAAADRWPKLYAKNCTDLTSQMCNVQAFERAYYTNGINTLVEYTRPNEPEKEQDSSVSSIENAIDEATRIYYAWNNNKTIINMMQHCFTHEDQRSKQRLNIENILSGARNSFKRPAKHELDCRSLLMASYLGLISDVATLINESDVLPDVTDVQGNSAIMYAACGDQPETIDFLVDAGADVDTYNDACCTPLGITLLRYALEKRGVSHNAILQATLPPSATLRMIPRQSQDDILEWNINRESNADSLQKSSSKTRHAIVFRRGPDQPPLSRRKTVVLSKLELTKFEKKPTPFPDPFVEDKQHYDNINTQYMIKVAELFSQPNPDAVPYIFEVSDMRKDVDAQIEDDIKKVIEKPVKKGPIKQTLANKPSRDEMFQEKEEVALETTTNPMKQEKLSRIMQTILQLLSLGADPRKVKCPQPPMFIATVAGNGELIRELVKHGADVNEVYPQVYEYTTIDVAVSGPLTNDNLEVIHALLQCGANPDHRLKFFKRQFTYVSSTHHAQHLDIQDDVPGPTLLHAVLAKKIESDGEQYAHACDVRDRLLDLLLQYGCNPITQYKGHSAVDIALNKSLQLFEIFLRSPRTDLNAIINDSNQTILVKMFHLPFSSTIPLLEKLQILTNLLLFGADPLIKCRNGEDEFENLFVFARGILFNMQSFRKPSSVAPSKSAKKPLPVKPDIKGRKSLKPVLSKHKTNEENPGDYRQALELVVECARLLYIRWLQAKLMKELIEVVNKYKQRDWTMIIKEHKNKKCTSLWVNVHRGLEIWDVLKTTKKKIYKDDKILNQVLCIIHFYFMRSRVLRFPSIEKTWRSPRITFKEKEFIESEVKQFTRDHKLATMSGPDLMPAIRQYVTPELTVNEVEKFNVCFDCAMPLEGFKILCDSCKLVSFCSFDCMKTNIDRLNCHPCSEYLSEKYFPPIEQVEASSEELFLIDY